MTKLLKNVPVLDSGSRGATTTFVQRGQGDVLLAWENEAFLAVNELGKGQFDIIVPSVSIRAEPPVSIVDANVDKHGTRAVATAYLQYLYTRPAQQIIAKNYYRPIDPVVAKQTADKFPHLQLFPRSRISAGGPRRRRRTSPTARRSIRFLLQPSNSSQYRDGYSVA